MDVQPVPEDEAYDHRGPRSTGFRLDNEMHGVWKFYRRDGSIMRSGEFDRGRQTGIWRTFDRSGRLVSEKDFGSVEP